MNMKLCNSINIMVCIHINIHVDVGFQIWIGSRTTDYLQKELAKQFSNAIITIFFNDTMLTI